MEQHHTPEAARFFTTMAGNEKKHGDELRARPRAALRRRAGRVKRGNCGTSRRRATTRCAR